MHTLKTLSFLIPLLAFGYIPTAWACDPAVAVCKDQPCDNETAIGTTRLDNGAKNIIACLNDDSGGQIWKATTGTNGENGTAGAPGGSGTSAPTVVINQCEHGLTGSLTPGNNPSITPEINTLTTLTCSITIPYEGKWVITGEASTQRRVPYVLKDYANFAASLSINGKTIDSYAMHYDNTAHKYLCYEGCTSFPSTIFHESGAAPSAPNILGTLGSHYGQEPGQDYFSYIYIHTGPAVTISTVLSSDKVFFQGIQLKASKMAE